MKVNHQTQHLLRQEEALNGLKTFRHVLITTLARL